MATGPKKIENRGGKRENAGRKPEKTITLTQQQVNAMLRKAKKFARARGSDLDDQLLLLAYEAKSETTKLAAIKLFKELTQAKLTEGGETDKGGPQLFLPEKKAEVRVIDGGKKEAG